MICSYTVENFKAIGDKAEVDFYANMNIKRFGFNVTKIGNKNVLKSTGFYGPNNTGKSCILLSILGLRTIMLGQPHINFKNAFAKMGDVTKYSVEYAIDGRFYFYSVSYNNLTRMYESESLYRREYSENSKQDTRIFERRKSGVAWHDMATNLKSIGLAGFFSPAYPFMLLYSLTDDELINQAKKDYLEFANSILFLKMDGPVDINKTIDLIQKDKKAARFVKEFVKNCDLHISDFGFDDNVVSDTDINEQMQTVANNPAFVKESLKFYSKHSGFRVPSVFFDSVGTQKLVALSGYIYDAIHDGKVLIVDEIDSSLHHLVTKAIVAMFNNSLNTKAQLIFTTHDVLLMDLKTLMRKDQVWLVDMGENSSSKVTRMADAFTSRSEDGIRGDEDVTDYYLKGRFSSIPSPDLFGALEEAVSND